MFEQIMYEQHKCPQPTVNGTILQSRVGAEPTFRPSPFQRADKAPSRIGSIATQMSQSHCCKSIYRPTFHRAGIHTLYLIQCILVFSK